MSKHAFELRDSEGELARLVDEVARGDEVVITRDGQPVAQIIPMERKKPREFGSGKGTFIVAPDFNEPLDDFESFLVDEPHGRPEVIQPSITDKDEVTVIRRAAAGIWRDRTDAPATTQRGEIA